MANEAGACQTRNVGNYDDEEEDEKQAAPLDEVGGSDRREGDCPCAWAVAGWHASIAGLPSQAY